MVRIQIASNARCYCVAHLPRVRKFLSNPINVHDLLCRVLMAEQLRVEFTQLLSLFLR